MGRGPEPCDLSFVFPAWNEEATIGRTVGSALEVGAWSVELGEISSFEVIVVDDASTDTTAEIVEDLADRCPQVRLYRHSTNRKLGATLRTGFSHAEGALVLYTDADLPFDLFETPRILRLMRVYDADIVSAYRYDRTGEGSRRYVYSRAYNLLVRAALGLHVRDVNFAAKLIRSEVLDAIELRSEGSFIDAELLARAQRHGFRIIQVGLDYFPRARGISTLSTPGVIAKMLREMRQLRAEIRSTAGRRSP